MMSQNKQKDKGSRWEREAAELLSTEFPGSWRRVPMSGAMGTILEIPDLNGDLRGNYSFFPQKFIGEAKVGYGGTEMTVRKEWFDKVKEEASKSYALPVVLLKFEKARSGVRHVIAMDFHTWGIVMAYVEELRKEVEELREND